VIWGAALYWWSGLLYLGQGAEVVRRFPLDKRKPLVEADAEADNR
jgi:cardiolipin synthase